MWISRKHYNALNERIAEQKQQLKYQQFILDACRKVDMSAKELMNEFQSHSNSSSSKGEIR